MWVEYFMSIVIIQFFSLISKVNYWNIAVHKDVNLRYSTLIKAPYLTLTRLTSPSLSSKLSVELLLQYDLEKVHLWEQNVTFCNLWGTHDQVRETLISCWAVRTNGWVGDGWCLWPRQQQGIWALPAMAPLQIGGVGGKATTLEWCGGGVGLGGGKASERQFSRSRKEETHQSDCAAF